MNSILFQTAAPRIARYPLKKWALETRIEAMDPAYQLSCHRIGSTTRFQGNNSSHWFSLMFSMDQCAVVEQDFLRKVVLQFETTGDTRLSNIEIYDGPTLLWKNSAITMQGNYTYAIGPENCWDFDPALNISHDLFIVFVVNFGFKDHSSPGFVFHGARALFTGEERCEKLVAV